MKKLVRPAQPENSAMIAWRVCTAVALSLIFAGFMLDTPANILKGLRTYIVSPDVLVTDYFVIGSIGAALVNAGLVTLISIAFTLIVKTPYNGSTLAMMFLMAGFALFGKNPINILPFFLGVWVYSKIKKVPIARYTNAAMFSTTLAPIVSDVMLKAPVPQVFRLPLAVIAGALIGYLMIPLAEHAFSAHMGYTLFNYGFAGGLMALIIASLSKAMGHPVKTVMLWHTGVPNAILIYLIVLIAALMVGGFYLAGCDIKSCLRITRHAGRAPTDFVITDGIGVTLFNMGAMGVVSIAYILLIGGDLNGPVVGAILTSIGFGAAGEHPKNSVPVIFGVYLASSVMTQTHTDPGMQLAALFGTALAPISGQFGMHHGVAAGFVHAALVLATAEPCGGYNLYNNGFSAGLVALVMVSIIQGISPKWRNSDR